MEERQLRAYKKIAEQFLAYGLLKNPTDFLLMVYNGNGGGLEDWKIGGLED